MKEILKAAYGEEFHDKLEELDREFDKIEHRYLQWFKARPNVGGEHDRLKNHTIFGYGTNTKVVTFDFIGNELPEAVKEDCIAAFYKVFQKGDIQP